ncbi:hypothetical protein [Streptomyces sp. NPDC059247]
MPFPNAAPSLRSGARSIGRAPGASPTSGPVTCSMRLARQRGAHA